MTADQQPPDVPPSIADSDDPSGNPNPSSGERGCLRAMVPWRDPSESVPMHLFRCVFQMMPVLVVGCAAAAPAVEVVRWAL